jgi:hypothetical protein
MESGAVELVGKCIQLEWVEKLNAREGSVGNDGENIHRAPRMGPRSTADQ